MKFYIPDRLERFGSEDSRIANAAQDELEERAEEYARYESEIKVRLPRRFRDLLDQFYLHDARVIYQPPLSVTYLDWLEHALRSGIPQDGGDSNGQTRCTPSHWIPLQLDTPPNEILVLQYRSVCIESVEFHQSIFEDFGYLGWLYDEVELIQGGEVLEFRHSILFTRGLELRLRFKDFDFATLKPTEIAEDIEVATR